MTNFMFVMHPGIRMVGSKVITEKHATSQNRVCFEKTHILGHMSGMRFPKTFG